MTKLFRSASFRPLARLIVSLLVVILILIIAVLTISWQISRGMERDIEQRLQRAISQFDATLQNAETAANAVHDYLGKTCNTETQDALRYQVTVVPDIRTVNLATGDNVYCSSLAGKYSTSVSTSKYVGGMLLMLNGNPVTPNRSLIAFRKSYGEHSVLVGVDGYYLKNVLELLQTPTEIRLLVGTSWMDSSGHVSDEKFQPNGTSYFQTSTRFPYTVATEIPTSTHWEYVWEYSSGSIILFPLLAVLLGFVTYRTMGRVNSPLSELRSGLKNHEFIPFIQPVVSGNTNDLTGCEVLMRWRHPLMGMIAPNQFIPLAEESGLIVPMTQDLMAQVRDYFAPLAERLPYNFHFGINISASHFKDLSLVEDCRQFLAAFEGYKIQLVLELTERQLIVPSEMTHRIFHELHELGVLIALDDFGTGHSSLAYLREFHIDILKIDQSFIRMIGSDALSGHIVDNVIDLAKRLQMVTVAEGVETPEQAEHLKQYNLDFLQGYLFGRPEDLKIFSDKWLL